MEARVRKLVFARSRYDAPRDVVAQVCNVSRELVLDILEGTTTPDEVTARIYRAAGYRVILADVVIDLLSTTCKQLSVALRAPEKSEMMIGPSFVDTLF